MYNLTPEEKQKVDIIRQKRIEFMSEQSKRWKTIPKEQTRMAGYKPFQSLDGEGIRCSLYVSGCHFNCLECYSPHAQNKNYGEILTDDMIDDIIEDIKKPYCDGLTLCGGEMFLNAPRLLEVVKRVKSETGKTVWGYTGYLFEILQNLDENDLRKLLFYQLDVLIDGQFILELRDSKNPPRFRGSSNQRIIDVQKSLDSGIITLWNDK